MRGLVAAVAIAAAFGGAGVAGHGPDTIFARDGQRDSLSGGPGKEDRARVDRGLDKVYDTEGFL